MTTEAQVIRVIAEVLEISVRDIHPADRFIDDLGANSLDIVNLIWRIEDVFALGEVDEESLEKMATVADLISFVEAMRSPEPSEAVAVYDVALASDHAGYSLKRELIRWLKQHDYTVLDLGPNEALRVDYPDFAEILAHKVAHGEADKGILICGSGIGMAISANKIAGIRATIAPDPVHAALAREHNDINVLCLGARLTGEDMAIASVKAFLKTAFDPGNDGRHQRRVRRIVELEKPEKSAGQRR